MSSGVLFKFKTGNKRWKNAFLREASKDQEGFYLKVDGRNQQNEGEQLFLYLDEDDVRRVLNGWVEQLDLVLLKEDAL